MIEVAAEPVVIAMPLSPVAGRHGQRPGQRAGRDVADQPGHRPPPPSPPGSAPYVLASAVALTVIVSLAPLAVTEVAAEPVVIAIVVVGRIAGGHGQCPGQRAGRDVADQPGHPPPPSPPGQRRILGQRRRIP